MAHSARLASLACRALVERDSPERARLALCAGSGARGQVCSTMLCMSFSSLSQWVGLQPPGSLRDSRSIPDPNRAVKANLPGTHPGTHRVVSADAVWPRKYIPGTELTRGAPGRERQRAREGTRRAGTSFASRARTRRQGACRHEFCLARAKARGVPGRLARAGARPGGGGAAAPYIVSISGSKNPRPQG